MTKLQQAQEFDLEEHTTECDISYRGGTLKIDVSDIFPDLADKLYGRSSKPIIGAYQNYLGGGIAGAIQGAAMFDPAELSKADQKVFHALKDRIVAYFHALNNGGGDEYMQENYGTLDQNQNLPVSAY